ncbi:MAG TPA: wax ester/triacylglycerol synthase family O-acyltransferase [Acidimicrobiia bacterium]|nr:wax ester/triacylglycerol synthase family O-acyltransferase [Acidimicrobiia bacterium]
MTTYDRLSALDESFLHLERPDTPMHVGAVVVLEGDPFYGPDGRFRLDDVRTLVRARLATLPRFRRTVVPAPLGAGRPIWVDDPEFDVARHVRLTALPEPGTRRQLLALAERLIAQVLDRSHPLWQMWFVEGVDGGKRVGLVHRSHHALTDGISGVDIATALLDLDAHAPPDVPSAWSPEPGPDPTELLVDTVRTNAARAKGLAGRAREAARMPLVAADQAGRLGRALGSLVTSGVVAPRLSHNRSLAPGRRLETMTVPLALVHEVRDALGCTVNDVALAAVGGGFARLLESRGELTDDLVVKMLCPVSLRVEADRAQLGNRISTMLVPVPVGQRDARARVAAIRAQTAELKEREQAVGTATIFGLGEYVTPSVLGVAARALHGQPFGNLVMSNIPGPPVPLYLLGAQMLEVYPIVPLSQNLTLNVAVLSYCDQLHIGLVGDGASARDLELLAGGIEDAFAELYAIARAEAE